MGRRQGGAGQRPSDECKVAWCNESVNGHTEDGHVGYLLSEIVEDQHGGRPATLEVLLVGNDRHRPRLAVAIGTARAMRHQAVLLTSKQIGRVRDALNEGAQRIEGGR